MGRGDYSPEVERGCDGEGEPLELLCKLDLVEEDPRIMILVIEAIFELPDAFHRTIYFFVPTKHQKDGICLSELRVEGSYDLYGFCVLFAGVTSEEIGYRGPLAVGFAGETKDGMETDLREEKRTESKEDGIKRGREERERKRDVRG